MDTIAFEDGADNLDVPVADVLRCMDQGLHLPVAAAVAVVLHMLRLAILVLALFACVFVYCFTLSWLALLWLQSCLLAFSAALLRACFSDAAIAHTQQARLRFASRPDTKAGRTNGPLPSEIWLTDPEADLRHCEPSPDLTNSMTQQSTVADVHTLSVVVNVKGEHNRNETRRPASGVAEAANANVSNESKAMETAPPADLPKTVAEEPKFARFHGKTVAEGSSQDGEKSQQRGNAVRDGAAATRRALAETEKKSNAQKVFVDGLISGSLRRESASPNASHHEKLRLQPASVKAEPRGNPFNVTPEQLAEASSFMAGASRGCESKGKSGRNMPNTVTTKPALTAVQRPQAKVSSPRVPRAAVPSTTLPDPPSASTVPVIPPHIRKSMEAKAHAQNCIGETSLPSQEQLEHDAISSRKRPSLSERLTFYDTAPDIMRPAEGAISGAGLGSFNNASSHAVDDRIDDARSILSGKSAPEAHAAPRRGVLSTTFSERPIQQISPSLRTPATTVRNPSDDGVLSINGEVEPRTGVVQTAIKAQQVQADAKLAAVEQTSGVDQSAQLQNGDQQLHQLENLDEPSDLIDLDCSKGGSSDFMLANTANGISVKVEPKSPTILAYPGSGVVDAIKPAVPLKPAGICTGAPSPSGTSGEDPLVAMPSAKPIGLDKASGQNLAAFDALLPPRTLADFRSGYPPANGVTKIAGLNDLEQNLDASRSPVPTNAAGKETNGVDGVVSPPAWHKNALYEANGAAEETKKQVKERKRMARESLKQAWVDRENARVKVLGSWSLDNMQGLTDTTHIYNAKRSELAAIMHGGQLNEDDEAVYPVFSSSSLAAPEARPQGFRELMLRKKTTREDGESSSNDKENNLFKAELDGLQDNMLAARKLREDAIALQTSPRPNTNVAFRTWKDGATAKLKRADVYYKSKRKALAAAYPDGVLPAGLDAQFPEI